jgi:hypothetical protein
MNDSDAPIVKELVYQAAMRARVAPSTRPQPGHIHAGHGDAGQSAESERRE